MMMITKLFYLDLSRKKCCRKIIRSKNFKQNVRHQDVEAEAVEEEALRVGVEAIQKLLLLHSYFGIRKRFVRIFFIKLVMFFAVT